MNLSRGERFKDARIIHNKNGKQTQAEVYTATGVPASCIKELEDDEKQRNVGYEAIVKLARHYGVSVDWLLGISEIRTLDTEVREICEYIGLSEEAVEKLHSISNSFDVVGIDGPGLMSDFITAPSFEASLYSLYRLKSDVKNMKASLQRGWIENLNFEAQIRPLELEIEKAFGFHVSVLPPMHNALYEINTFTSIAENLAKEVSGYDRLSYAERYDPAVAATPEELKAYFNSIYSKEAENGEYSQD